MLVSTYMSPFMPYISQLRPPRHENFPILVFLDIHLVKLLQVTQAVQDDDNEALKQDYFPS